MKNYSITNRIYRSNFLWRNGLIVLLILISISAKSQLIKGKQQPKNYYKSGIMKMKDFTSYNCTDIHVSADSLMFVNKATQQQYKIATTNIDYIKVKEGNQAVGGAIIGALAVGLTTKFYSVQNHGDPNQKIVIMSTFSGAIVGVLVGLAIPKWKKYSFHN